MKLISSMCTVTQKVTVILNQIATKYFTDIEQKTDTSPIIQIHVLLNVLISLLRLKFIKLEYCILGGFLGINRTVIHEENWANHPFKRKLYLIYHDLTDQYCVISFGDVTEVDVYSQ